jgi:hypothetical protein
MVCVVTFLSNVCSEVCSMAAEMTHISVELDEEIIEGIKAVGDLDQMQKSEEAAHTANHGATVRPQRSMLNTKSKNYKEIDDAVGCPRGGTITKSVKFPFSASTPVRELCLSEFSPVCSAPGLEESDICVSVFHEYKCVFCCASVFQQASMVDEFEKCKLEKSLLRVLKKSRTSRVVSHCGSTL